MSKVPEYFGTPNKLYAALQDIATQDTAEYFYSIQSPPEFITTDAEPETFETLNAAKARLRKEIADECTLDGYVAEYGVNKGESFIQLCDIFKDDTVFGFDAFEGLPEGGKWEGNTIHKGQFANGGKPPFEIPGNGVISSGWFDKTLPNFDYKKQQAKFLHIDCDVYSSTVTILDNVKDSIVAGTVIVFDDYCNYTGWRIGEWKAWQEFTTKHNISYEYVYVAGMAAGVKITERA